MASQFAEQTIGGKPNRVRAPDYVACPICRQSYAVYHSRAKLRKAWPMRALLNYYRCDRCQCRFASPKMSLIAFMLGGGACLALLAWWLI